jgi:Zn-dependent protease
VMAFLLRYLYPMAADLPVARFFLQFMAFFVQINVLLFVFNLIPVPPLDGSHVLFALMPGDTYSLRVQLSRYGLLVIFAVIFLFPQIITVPASWVMGTLGL